MAEHRLDNPDFAKQVAELLVAGQTRKQMAEVFDVSPWTITQWKKDPRVKAPALKLVDERIIQITRKIDATIEERLQNPTQLTVRELVDLRKEYLGGAARAQTEKADELTVTAAMEALEANPELVEELQQVLEGAKRKHQEA